jgi:hypothetical protein
MGSGYAAGWECVAYGGQGCDPVAHMEAGRIVICDARHCPGRMREVPSNNAFVSFPTGPVVSAPVVFFYFFFRVL